MAETLNRSELAAACGVSLPTISSWVRRGCPFVTEGTNGKEWAFDLEQVQAWRERYTAKPTELTIKGFRYIFNSPEAAAVVKALGHMVARIGTVAAEQAIRTGVPLRTAYAIDTLVCIAASALADGYLRTRGVRTHHSVLEMFDPEVTSPDYTALAAQAGEQFDADEAQAFLDEIMFGPAEPGDEKPTDTEVVSQFGFSQ